MSRSGSGYHHGDLAAALERAALELLETTGHASLSLREVARRADVSHNAPYHHFGDRAALLTRLAELSMAALLDAQEAAVAAAGPSPRDRAQAMGAAYIGWARAHPGGFAVVFDPEVCTPGAPTEAMGRLIARNEQLLAEIVAAVDPDLDPAQVDARATLAWGAVHGLAQLAIAGHIPPAAVAPALRELL